MLNNLNKTIMNNIISNNAKSVKNAKMIQIIVRENDLTISRELSNYSCCDLLSATLEIVSKLFDKQTVANATKKFNTDSKSKSAKNAKNIEIVFTENDLSISKTLTNCSCFDVLSATFEIVSKLFDKQTVAKAIKNLNPDSESNDDSKPKAKSKSKSKTPKTSKTESPEPTPTQTESKLAA